ncbi:MAG: hypothetical protein WBQ07_03420 [Candidatus Acidiferrales bacterium]
MRADAGAIVVGEWSVLDSEDGAFAEELSGRRREGKHHRADHGRMIEAEPVAELVD